MIPGYRYRYPKYSHTELITDTGFIPIFFIPIPIPGIDTWYRYLVSVPGIGIMPGIGGTLHQRLGPERARRQVLDQRRLGQPLTRGEGLSGWGTRGTSRSNPNRSILSTSWNIF